jgi:hypothetical protein
MLATVRQSRKHGMNQSQFRSALSVHGERTAVSNALSLAENVGGNYKMTTSRLILFLVLSSIGVFGQIPKLPDNYDYQIQEFRVFPDTFHLTTEYYNQYDQVIYLAKYLDRLPTEFELSVYRDSLIVKKEFYRGVKLYKQDVYKYSENTVINTQTSSDSSGFITVSMFSNKSLDTLLSYKSYEFYKSDTTLLWSFTCVHENGRMVSQLSEELDGWKTTYLIDSDTLVVKVDSTINNGQCDNFSKIYQYPELTIDTTYYSETDAWTVSREYFDEDKFNYRTEQYGRTIPICTDNGNRHQTLPALETPDHIYIRKKERKK